MIRNSHDPKKLASVCEQVGGGSVVIDFFKEAAYEKTGRREQIEAFLFKAYDNCVYDIPHLAAQIGRDGNIDVNISEVRAVLTSIRNNRVCEEIEYIASKLAENPDKMPHRRSRRKPAVSKDERMLETLSESCL